MEKPHQPRSTACTAPLLPQPIPVVRRNWPHKLSLEEIRRQLGWALITAARR